MNDNAFCEYEENREETREISESIKDFIERRRER